VARAARCRAMPNHSLGQELPQLHHAMALKVTGASNFWADGL